MELTRNADLLCMPVSASFIAKVAQGHADDLFSTAYLGGSRCDAASDEHEHVGAAVQRNLEQLQRWGGVRPARRGLAELSRRRGGRMAEPEQILIRHKMTFAFATTQRLLTSRLQKFPWLVF